MQFTSNKFQTRVAKNTQLYSGAKASGFGLAAIGSLVEVIGNYLETVIHSSDSDNQRHKSTVNDLLRNDEQLFSFMDVVVEKLNDSKTELSNGRHYGLIIRNVVREVLDDMLTA